MIYLGKHRVIKELDKEINRGQTLHFLTGDGINDNFFYDLHSGIKNMADTLRDYYVVRKKNFDYIVQVNSSSGDPICFSAAGKISFSDIINPPQRKGALGKKNRGTENSETANQGVDAANQAASNENSALLRLEETLHKREKRFLIFPYE